MYPSEDYCSWTLPCTQLKISHTVALIQVLAVTPAPTLTIYCAYQLSLLFQSFVRIAYYSHPSINLNMASDLTSSTNGMYANQYGQPAELAASVPASSQASNIPQTVTEPTMNTTVADPQQIGWYFVEQYYTTLSKHPDQIHLFYSKKSQLVIGIEAEKVLPCIGSQVRIEYLEIGQLRANNDRQGYQGQDPRTRYPRLQSPCPQCRLSNLIQQHRRPSHRCHVKQICSQQEVCPNVCSHTADKWLLRAQRRIPLPQR